MNRMPHAMRWVVLLFMLAAVGPHVEAQTLDDRIEDARAAARAQMALAEDDVLRSFVIRTSLERRGLIVRGRVASGAQRERAESVARTEWRGPVINEIEVTAEARRVTGPLPPRVAVQEARAPEPREAEARTEAAPTEPARPAPAEEAQYHTVRSGDTLSAIARQHNTSVGEIQRLNNLQGTRIRGGQRLRVR